MHEQGERATLRWACHHLVLLPRIAPASETRRYAMLQWYRSLSTHPRFCLLLTNISHSGAVLMSCTRIRAPCQPRLDEAPVCSSPPPPMGSGNSGLVWG